jgi:hypothetical protein
MSSSRTTHRTNDAGLENLSRETRRQGLDGLVELLEGWNSFCRGPHLCQCYHAVLVVQAPPTVSWILGPSARLVLSGGPKIGWGTNMSITAVLLAYAVWLVPTKLFGRQPFGILEDNLNQAAASAGAAISSPGLVAAIPALAVLTRKTLAWHWLVVWTFSVSAVGVVVAVAMRRQMLLVDKLPFPFGIATGETLREMYARGREAVTRVLVLLGAGVVAAVTKTVQERIGSLRDSVSRGARAARSYVEEAFGGSTAETVRREQLCCVVIEASSPGHPIRRWY